MRHHTSPLLPIGLVLGAGSYVVSAAVGVLYAIIGYPIQAAFGNDKAEPTLLWLMVPIAGPFMAQRQDWVRHEPGWRTTFIVDGVLQSVGLVAIIAGIVLSGRRPDDPIEDAGLNLRPGVAGSAAWGMTLSLRTR